ncbi:hypothetical protein B0T22DRAFT_313768 [Podospora appendiculata]|uniref:Succinate dehydrogenase assembly factor 4, mitochondrial n=1 Tax=Podospora appendiculata TaxID=314037 RepID=A0AAE1C701_9PEZI|nr:hypothetical protein B0T22DRAFT_313768 [Podospora appendiculata]
MSRRLLSLLRPLTARAPSIPTRRLASSFIQNEPSPPRLPAAQQAEFERLQRAAEAALHTHTQTEPTPSSSSPLTTSRHVSSPATSSTEKDQTPEQPVGQTVQAAAADGSAASLSGGIRKGAPPEFEGETNPKTGEVGGPKNEPLRWGSAGDWSYNGRVTDF